MPDSSFWVHGGVADAPSVVPERVGSSFWVHGGVTHAPSVVPEQEEGSRG